MLRARKRKDQTADKQCNKTFPFYVVPHLALGISAQGSTPGTIKNII